MKRLIILTTLCLILVFQLASCAFIGLGGTPNNDPISLTVVYPDSQTTVSVTPGSAVNFTPKYIDGKVLVGFYGQDSAVGYEYFDYKGHMNGIWKSEYPNTVYAIYEEPDYSIKHISAFGHEEDPKAYYLGGGKGYTLTFKSDTLKANKELFQLLYSCPNIEVKITMHAEIKQHGDHAVNTTFSFGMGSDTFAECDFPSSPSEYDAISVTKTIKGKQLYLSDSNIYARLVWHGSRVESYGLVKNIYYSISIVPPTSDS